MKYNQRADARQVLVWGRNNYGQLGLQHTSNVRRPVPLQDPPWSENERVEMLSVASESTFVLLGMKNPILGPLEHSTHAPPGSGILYATGWNEHGNLGVGDTADRHSFAPVLGDARTAVEYIWSGSAHSFVQVSTRMDV